VFDAVLSVLDELTALTPRPAGRGGPALGPTAPAATCWCSCCRGWTRSAWSCWPPTAPTTCTAATRCGPCSPSWCGCRPSSASSSTRSTRPTRSCSCGGWPTARCPRPLLHRVALRSEGNAFFAEELVSACSDDLPASLVDVLLTASSAAGGGAAAAAGGGGGRPRVRHDQLAAVSGLGVDELEQALRDAVNHHVLVPEAGEGYAFRHALLREAIDRDLLPGERTRLHAAFAAMLADPARPDEPGRAARSPHHALAAHDLPGALAASVRAAREADEREAPAELLLHAERALELWSAVPDAEAVAGAPEYKLTRMAAWAASATGDPDRGTALGGARSSWPRSAATPG
jgi:hypothetical protein